MKIVIDIPDKLYRKIQMELVGGEVCECVKNGTPLPKGHGRLIDADDLDITTITTDDYSGNEVLEVVLKENIDNALPIIEADKGEEE